MVENSAHDGIRLARLMERAGLNKAQLAEKLSVSDAAVGKWISSGQFSRSNVAPICLALKCSADELLGLVAIGPRYRVREIEPNDDFNRSRMSEAISWTLEAWDIMEDRSPEEGAEFILAIFDMLVEAKDNISKPVVLRMIRSAA